MTPEEQIKELKEDIESLESENENLTEELRLSHITIEQLKRQIK
jgi:hypothetical protein